MSDKIEGVPLGMRIAVIRPPRIGDWVISLTGKAIMAQQGTKAFYTIVVPCDDNPYGVPLETVLIPPGYRLEGTTLEESFRPPQFADNFINPKNWGWLSLRLGCSDVRDKRIIIVPTVRTVIISVELKGSESLDNFLSDVGHYGKLTSVETRETK